MALGIYEEEDIRALAEEIREQAGGGSRMTVKEMKGAIRDVHEAGRGYGFSEGHVMGRIEGLEEGKSIGYAEGKADGIAVGVVQGRNEVYTELEPINSELEQTLYGTDTGGKSFYDEFWDVLQDNGNSRMYMACFGGFFWNEITLRPKYDIINPSSAAYMFYCNAMKVDLVKYFEGIGKKLQFEDNTSIYNGTYQYSRFTRVPAMYTSNDGWYSTFYGCLFLVTIDEVGNIDENGDVLFRGDTFNTCYALENIKIRGKIVNETSFRSSIKLSKASIISIINALSTTTSGLSVTLSKTAVKTAFGSTESEEWIALINTRSNWTINLA